MNERQKVTVRVDGYTRVCLTAIVVLLSVLILGLWCDGVRWSPAARAADGFGDISAPIAQQLEVQKQISGKLDTLIKLMSSGEVKVQLVGDNKPAGDGGNGSATSKK